MSRNGRILLPKGMQPGHQPKPRIYRQDNADIEAPKPGAPQGDVFLAYLATNNVTTSFHRSMTDLIVRDGKGPRRIHQWGSSRASHFNIDAARNQLTQEMLASSAQWLFMVDSDMGFAADTLDRLLLCADPEKRPVVGALCFAMREAGPDGLGGWVTLPSPTIFQWSDAMGHWSFVGMTRYPVNMLIPVGATGAACILIHRAVLEAIESDWFTLKTGNDGNLQGEDMSFCDRCRERNVPVHLHTGIRTTHFKSVWLGESDFWASRVARPATEQIDVLIPTVGQRLENIRRVLTSLRASTGLATAWVVVEPDDDESARVAEECGAIVLREHGSYSYALNYAYRAAAKYDGVGPAPWVMMAADDVSFRPGWLDHVQEVAGLWSGDVIATNDLLNPRVMQGSHATHPVLRRNYVEKHGGGWDGPGVLAHEGYHHHYVDDEITFAAKLRGSFQSALGAYVVHHHPLGGAPTDATYERNFATLDDDHKLYERRAGKAIARLSQEPQERLESARDAERTQ